jgi:RNA polymerase sigma-70 factor (ECF subfamily)
VQYNPIKGKIVWYLLMSITNKELKNLVEQIKCGQMTSFDPFYEATKRIIFFNIYSYVKHHETAEDILQDTYVAFLKSVSNIDNSQPILAYLLTISKNLSLNYLRTSSRQVPLNETFEDTHGVNQNYSIEENELIKKIKDLLKPEEFRIFYLKAVEEYTHQEIANLLYKSLGTITWAYNNAIKKLQKGLKNIYETK